MLVSGLEVGFPFLLLDGYLDAEMFFPHVLIGFAEAFGEVAVGSEQGYFWEAIAVGESGIGEELAGFFRIEMDGVRRRVVTNGRGESISGELPTLGYAVDDRLLIDGERECLADTRIRKAGAVDIAADKKSAEVGLLVETFWVVLAGVFDHFRCQPVSAVDLLIKKHTGLGVAIADGEEADPFE